jgi:hypothetical protein
LVADEKVWLWWYDRQGPLQVAAIDLIRELPRFLVLLLCMQRFGLDDWGFVPHLDPLAVKMHRPPPPPPPQEQASPSAVQIKYDHCTITLTSDITVQHFCLTGRGTSTALVDKLQPEPDSHPLEMPPWATGPDTGKFHLKLAWIDTSRESEAEILRTLRQRLENSPDIDRDKRISNHLPWIVASKDHGIFTGTIRETFNFDPLRDGETIVGSRVLRSIVAEMLHPVTELSPEAYYRAHLDIAGCLSHRSI